MAPNLTQIAEEFEISDEERDARLGGDVSIAFFIVGGPVGIVAGWYTDRYPRNIMYGSVALIGSIGSFLTFCVTSHTTLLLARAVTGISIGGASPILFSLLSDLFSVDKRNLVVAMVGFSISLGTFFFLSLFLNVKKKKFTKDTNNVNIKTHTHTYTYRKYVGTNDECSSWCLTRMEITIFIC